MRYPEKEEIFSTAMEEKAYIRFLHALPNDPPVNVDVYVNNKLIVKNFKYEDFTEYMPAKPGSYVVRVYPTGNNLEKLLEMKIALSNCEIVTASIIGTVSSVELELIGDYSREIDDKISYMRFINFSPEDAPVNIYMDDKAVVLDLQFTEVTEYLPFDPGTHTMTVELAKDKKPIVYHPALFLKGGNYYATYVVGFPKGRPLMEVLIPLEGTSYLKF